jgi:hypothetical protein
VNRFMSYALPIAALVCSVLAIALSCHPAHAMDMVTACAQGCEGCCLMHRIQILFAMLGGWN